MQPIDYFMAGLVAGALIVISIQLMKPGRNG